MQNNEVKHIVFILGSISQPRCHKRIKSFQTQGYKTTIYGFNRGVYTSIKHTNLDINIIGNVKDGTNYFGKLYSSYRAIKIVNERYRNENVYYYCFGLLISIILFINRNNKYIYEVSDILYAYKKYGFLQYILKYIDKLIIKKSILTVFTSEGFVRYFFKNKTPNHIIVQPNKLNSSFNNLNKEIRIKHFNPDRIIFGFVGAPRYPNTIFRFAKIVGKNYPQHEFHFYGESIMSPLVVNLAKEFTNIQYHGSFKNPDDLSAIYQNLDLIVACYDTKDVNERIAEPNKLFESIYFKKPIIVSKDTYVSKRVLELNCGFSIDATSDTAIVDFIDSIKIEKINGLWSCIQKIESSEIIDDNSQLLINKLNKL